MSSSHRIGLIVLCAVFAGCVSAKKHKALEVKWTKTGEQVREADELNTQLRAKLDAADKKITQLESDVGRLSSEKKTLETFNASLSQALKAKKGELTNMVSRLNTEKATLSLKVQSLETKNVSLRVETASLLSTLKENKKELKKEKEAAVAKLSKDYDDLMKGLKDEIYEGNVQISRMKGRLTVKVADKLFFDSGLADIHKSGKDVLKRLSKILKGVKGKIIRVEGHTDNVPISRKLRDQYPTNWELSTARAVNVVRFFQEKGGIPPERLVSMGYGSFRPVADNSTIEGRAKNRRIEIALVEPNVDRETFEQEEAAGE